MNKKLVLREYYALCEGGTCQDLLTEDEKRYVANGGMILSGIMQKADAINGNGRVYPHKVLMKEVEKEGFDLRPRIKCKMSEEEQQQN